MFSPLHLSEDAMYKKQSYRRRERMRRRRYSINLFGLFIFIAKVFYFLAWLYLPFLLWDFARLDHVAGGHFIQYKPFMILFMYVMLAAEFVQNPSLFILQGPPWNERVFIERITYEDDGYYDG
jgi:hypothetical protein